MSKQRKKRKRSQARQKADRSGSGGADESVILGQLCEALTAGRGRRAIKLADSVDGAGGALAGPMADLVGAAAELRIRELFRDRHPESAVALGRRIAGKAPDAADRWPLGLRCRLGMAENLPSPYADEGIRTRLRRETMDPAELLGYPCERTARDGQAILEAWDRSDDGDEEGAEDLLRQVGRQSALIDWRLFLQAQIGLRRGQAEHFAANRSRVHPDSPVRRMLEALAGGDAPTGSADDPFPALVHDCSSRGRLDGVGALKGTAAGVPQLRALQGVYRRFRATGHPALAGKLLSGFLYLADAKDEACSRKVFDEFGYATVTEGLLRVFWEIDDGWEEVDEAIGYLLSQARGMSARERAFLLWLRCEAAHREALLDPWSFTPIDFLEPMDDFPPSPTRVIGWAREAAGLWPELEGVYKVWDWAEQEGGQGTEALAAWRAAFPDRPDVLSRYIEARVERLDLAGVDADVDTLAGMPGQGERAARLTSRYQLAEVRRALLCDDVGRVDELAGAFEPGDAHDRVMMATYVWLAASSKGEKARRGRELGQAGSPWLVAALAASLDAGLTYSRLPAGVKTALKAPPEQGVPQWLDAVAVMPDAITHLVRHNKLYDLMETLFESVRDPELAQDLVRFVLQDLRGSERIYAEMDLLIFPLTALLLRQGDPRWVAIGLATRGRLVRRIQMHAHLPDDFITRRAEELFRAACGRLADRAEARELIEPYLAQSAMSWSDLNLAAAEVDVQAVIDREQRYDDLTQWRMTWMGSTPPGIPHGPFPVAPPWEDDRGEYDESEDEWKDEPLFQPGRSDVDLPDFPPTTHLEAEILCDQVLQIEDRNLRNRRWDELRALVDASSLKGRAIESLRERMNKEIAKP